MILDIYKHKKVKKNWSLKKTILYTILYLFNDI